MQISTCLVFYEKKKKSCHVLAPVLHVSYLVSFPEMGKTTKGCNLNTSMWWHSVREQINVMATFSKKRPGALTFVAPISSHKGMGKVPKSNLGNVGRHKLVLNSVTIPALHAITKQSTNYTWGVLEDIMCVQFHHNTCISCNNKTIKWIKINYDKQQRAKNLKFV